ncbi:TonB-dependent receptor [Labilibacter sediminis]|nr:TonB-dependent receptor [Labilibacter sediminis]
MKNLFLSSILCLMAFQFSMAQYKVAGKVTSTDNEALIGASVVLGSGKLGMSTSTNGTFEFTNIKAGKYTLNVTYIGYESYSTSLEVKENTNINIQLAAKSVLTGEVVVSSIKASDKTPVAKTNISKEQLQSLNAADDIPLLLSMTPSVVSSTESGIGVGYSSMRIRGTDATRINVTVNGIPLNDSESQGVFWVNMPDFSSSVDEVQIQRGVGTSTNGAAAFGATVNFNTTSYHAEPFTEISSTAGSFNTFKNSISASTGLLHNKFSFDVRYSDVQSDGYIDYAFSDHQSLYLSGAMHLENSFLKANIIHGKQRTGISWWGIDKETLETNRTYNPAGQYEDEDGVQRYYEDQTDNYTQTHYQLFYSQNLSSEWLLNTALHYTKGEGYYEQYKEDEAYADYGWDPYLIEGTDPIETTDLIRQKWLTNDFYGFTASLNYNTTELQATFGGGWNRYDGDHFGEVIWARFAGKSEKGEEWYRNTGVKTDYNIYAKINYQLSEKLNVFGDIQYRGINYKMDGSDDDLSTLDQEHNYNFFNPKAGLFYELNKKHQIYASYAVAHREPTRANFKDANGDPEATPQEERLNDLELGYHFRSPKASANINFYYMYYKDQLVPTGEKSSVGYDIMTNVDKSYRTGIELDLGIELLPFLRWDGNTTISKNIIKDYVETATAHNADWSEIKDTIIYHGNSQIAFSPSLIVNSIFTFKPFKSNSISLVTKHVGDQYFDNTQSDLRKLDAYTVFNGIITQEFKPKWINKIELQLTVNNIFNKLYESNAYVWGGTYYESGNEYSWNYYYPQAGTHAFIRARFIF